MNTIRRTRRASGFTLIEVMIGVLIFSTLLAIAAPNMIRSRAQTRAKACSRILYNMAGVKEQYALENRKNIADPVSLSDIAPYLRGSTTCPANGTITPGAIGTDPLCNGSTVAYKHSIDGR